MNSRNAELDNIWKTNADLKMNIANIFKHNFSDSRWSHSGLFFSVTAENVRRDILDILERASLQDFYTHLYWNELMRQLPKKHNIPQQPSPCDDIDETVIYVLRRMVESVPDLAKLDIELDDKWNKVINQCNQKSTSKPALSN